MLVPQMNKTILLDYAAVKDTIIFIDNLSLQKI